MEGLELSHALKDLLFYGEITIIKRLLFLDNLWHVLEEWVISTVERGPSRRVGSLSHRSIIVLDVDSGVFLLAKGV